MRELSIDEIDQVSGAGVVGPIIAGVAANGANLCSNVNANLANVATNYNNLVALLCQL